MSLEFSVKYKDYEIHACPKRLARLSPDERNETIDFVKWAKDSAGREYCFSLAYFERDKEGYRLKFVGRRPFDYVDFEDIRTIWSLLKTAQGVLDNYFSLEEFEND